MDQFEKLRRAMVQFHIAARGISDARVLEAMEKVPREIFVDTQFAALAYEDTPLPIEEGQTISQPFIVALMIQGAALQPQDTVLEIGTGSGYSTAILSRLCSQVYSIERQAKLVELAQKRLQYLGCTNTQIQMKDGTMGWEEHAPYDAIIVTAGGPMVPPSFLKQLAMRGRLIMPVGISLVYQELMRVVREDVDRYEYEELGAVRFVPLIGQDGWKESTNKPNDFA